MQSDEITKVWNVAAGLYKHGPNIERLMEDLPGLKQSETEGIISRFRSRARNIIQTSSQAAHKGEPIYGWYEFLHNCEVLEGTSKAIPNSLYLKRKKRVARCVEANRYTHLLGKNFMYAAYFEEHFRGETDDDPDYSEIYRYLGQLLNGESPTQLKPQSALKVLEMLNLMCNVMNDSKTSKAYKQMMAKFFPSFLEKDKDIIEMAKEKQKTCGALRPESNCPMYQIDTELDISPQKKLTYQTLQKISEKQVETTSYLRTVPGFNPLELGNECLAKPSIAVLLSQKRFKRQKKN